MKVISPKRLLQSVFPTVRNGSIFNASSLDLQFARTKTLDPRVTFTRASSGTYVDSQGVIRTATTNEARFDHNPTTGESLGLLVEEARTNNVLQSEDFATTWTASNLTVTTNSVVAPDGTATADTIAPPADGLTVTRFLRQNPVLTTQQAYTLSVFVKVGTATTNGIALYVSDSAATNNFRGVFNLFTLATGASGTGWATPTSTIVPYPNGWYRCILSGVTSTAHTGLRAQIYLSAFGTTPDTYGSIHVWGAQLEAGSFPTSYIPTTTAAATRSADVASITGSNFSSWYRQDEGTMLAEFDSNTWNASDIFSKTFSFIDASPFGNDWWIGGADTNDVYRYRIRVSNSNLFGPATSQEIKLQEIKPPWQSKLLIQLCVETEGAW